MQQLSLFVRDEIGRATAWGLCSVLLLAGLCTIAILNSGVRDAMMQPASAKAATQIDSDSTSDRRAVAMKVNRSEPRPRTMPPAAFPPVHSKHYRILALIAAASSAAGPGR